MTQIEYSGPNHRRHPRVATRTGWIDIAGVRYRIGDVSTSGVRVKNYDGGHRAEDSFSFRLHIIAEPDDVLMIDGGAVVVRVSSGELAARFFFLDPEKVPTLEAYLDRQIRLKWSRMLIAAQADGSDKSGLPKVL